MIRYIRDRLPIVVGVALGLAVMLGAAGVLYVALFVAEIATDWLATR